MECSYAEYNHGPIARIMLYNWHTCLYGYSSMSISFWLSHFPFFMCMRIDNKQILLIWLQSCSIPFLCISCGKKTVYIRICIHMYTNTRPFTSNREAATASSNQAPSFYSYHSSCVLVVHVFVHVCVHTCMCATCKSSWVIKNSVNRIIATHKKQWNVTRAKHSLRRINLTIVKKIHKL